MKRWLKCKFYDSQLENEFVVVATGHRAVSGAVPKSAVKTNRVGDDTLVEVEVMDRGPGDGLWATLPTCPEQSIPICEDDLRWVKTEDGVGDGETKS